MSHDPNDTSNVELPAELIPADGRKALGEVFAPLKNNVELHIYTHEGAKDVFSRFVHKIAGELSECSTKISVFTHSEAESNALPGPSERPLMAIKAAGAAAPVLSMIGAPLGEEGKVMIQAIVLAGSGEPNLSAGAMKALSEIKYKREIKVFGTGSCGYCPGQMALAAACALARPDAITAYSIAADQFPELSRQYGVSGVPHTVVNEKYKVVGMLPDEPFASFLGSLTACSLGQYAEAAMDLPAPPTASEETPAGEAAKSAPKAAPMDLPLAPQGSAAPMDLPLAPQGSGSSPASAPTANLGVGEEASVEAFSLAQEKGDEFHPDLLVLGGGPAGLSAAIYGGRAGLNVTVLDHGTLGGQPNVTPVIENYPGFDAISGPKLASDFVKQAKIYAHVKGGMNITNLEAKDGHFIAHTSNGQYVGKALVLATGASWRRLGVPGEAHFSGRGVHYCATCDGYLYTGRKILIVGGGNSALTDALHLKNLDIDVTIIHRRDTFRGENALVNAVQRQGIPVIWDSTVAEITGADSVNAVRIKNIKTGEEKELPFDAVFVSVGLDPNSRPAMAVGAQLNEARYIKVDDKMRTSVPRVYAAGDVKGGFCQVVTAVASGAVAANTAFEDLQKD